MNIVAQEKKNSKRYLPHAVSTKEGAVKWNVATGMTRNDSIIT